MQTAPSWSAALNDRLSRERAFHDHFHTHGARPTTAPFYAVTQRSKAYYQDLVLRDAGGLAVLEYGCGSGSQAFKLATAGASVTGIDISPEAVKAARRRSAHLGSGSIEFLQMDAHDTDFDDNSFHRVCGSGILHHLDVETAVTETTRVLKPDGNAVFFEPLGHNPGINWYRRRTPHLRTPDERPLRMADLEMMRLKFGHVSARFFHLSDLMTVPLRRRASFPRWVQRAARFDDALFRFAPWSRKFAWIVVLSLSDPI